MPLYESMKDTHEKGLMLLAKEYPPDVIVRSLAMAMRKRADVYRDKGNERLGRLWTEYANEIDRVANTLN